MTLTATDLFSGFGGSTTGAESVSGTRTRIAGNHDPKAIAAHQLNHPHVDHDIADIHDTPPQRYPATDLLWASPSCTFWSAGRGERLDFVDDPNRLALFDLQDDDDEQDERSALPAEARERSRALMHDVPRFAEHHRYKAVIVENVPTLLRWWYFPKWIARMRALGYLHRVLTLNSAFAHQLGAPAPQLRDRVYVVFWQERYRAPDLERWTRPQAWCERCQETVTAMVAPRDPARPHGVYGQQYLYRCPNRTCRHAHVLPYALPAASVLDLSRPGTRIGDKPGKRRWGGLPLSPRTLARVEAELRRHADRPSGAQATAAGPGELVALAAGTRLPQFGGVPPLLVPVEGREGKRAFSSWRPHRTQTTRGETALLVPPGVGTGQDGAAWAPELLLAYDTGLMHPVGRSLMPTQTTVVGDALVQPEVQVWDCLLRMLTSEEIKLGMGMPEEFELLGNLAERTRMCGNAVTPPVARDLVAAVVEAITGETPTAVDPMRHRRQYRLAS